MKIAFLNIYNGIVQRGSEVFVDELATQLAKFAQISVYQSGTIKNSSYKSIVVKGIPFTTLLYDFWVLIFTLKCLPSLWKNKYNWIIPVNGRFQPVICRILRLIRGSKILITGHAGVGMEDRINISLGNPDVFVALTPAAYSFAKNISMGVKVIFIANGVNIRKFYPGAKKTNISLKKPIILCVSALLPYKRLDLLIKAAAKLKSVSVLIIGSGPLQNQLERLGLKLLKDRFKLINYIPHDKIAAYYRAADIFTLPSRISEAFGLVYLEAMACNLPVVAPDDKNRRRIIGNGGLYCNPQDTDQYANTLYRALNTDFDFKPRKQAEKYSWQKISIEYKDVFENKLND